jgi:anti-anti-sigma factor
MPEASFTVRMIGGVPVVATPEEVDISNAEGLRAALLEASAHGRGILVVDMSGTQFCDSSGIHVLIRAHKRARAEGGELLLVVPATTVLRVCAITGIDRMIPNFPSLQDALAAYLPPGRTASGHPDDADQKLDQAKSPQVAEAREPLSAT